jgi:hypothetical protein
VSEHDQNDTQNDQATAAGEQHESGTTHDPGAKGDQSEIKFTPEQQKLIDKRIADARRQGKQTAAEEAAEAKRKADEEAERDRQIKAGEFDQVKQSLELERDTATGERDALKAKLDAALALVSASLDQDWTAAPDQVTKLYRGDDTDVLAKRQFLTDHADIIAALSDKHEDRKQAAGFGRTPNPNGNAKDDKTPATRVRF